MIRKCYLLGLIMLVGVSACIVPAKASFAHAGKRLQNQELVIKGKVSGSDIGPLFGASVSVKGTGGGVITDADGNYSIPVNGPNAVLVFSFLGYQKQEVTVGNQTTIDVQLQVAVSDLSEVVVIGYGQIQKSDITGSVSSVKSEEIKAVPVTSFEQALQGRASGVQVAQTSGQPGAPASIRIRGVSSISASNEPLYVIDGMLINSSDASASTSSGPSISPLSAINPNDIESIEILKDASATAIYGSRGANGVVLITTKTGSAGISTINLESYYGVQQVTNELDLLNASQFGAYVNEARTNAGQQPTYVNPSNLGEGTNWQKEIFTTAPVQNYQLSFAGGSENVQYSISGGIFDQDGVIQNTDFTRYSVRSKINAKLNDYFKLNTSLSYANIKGTTANTGLQSFVPGVVGGALAMNPILPVFDPNERGGYTFQNVIGGATPEIGYVAGNPVAELNDIDNLSTNDRFIGNIDGELTIADGLVFKSLLGIDVTSSKDRNFQPSWLRAARPVGGIAQISTLQAFTWLNENTLTYDKQFNNDHHLNALVGFTAQQFKNEYVTNVAFGTSDELGYHNLSVATDPQTPTNGETKWSMISFLGRVHYNIQDKYLFTATGRMDGSSKFAENNKYAFFPSGAFAWRISEEPFMPATNFISDLKLKASVGIIGNQAIGPYASLPLVAPYGQGVFNNGLDVVSYTSSQMQAYNNPDLKWETTRTINTGFEAELFDGRIFLSAEYYQKYTYDLLLSTPIPSSSGFENTLLNVGNVKNNGLDIDLSTVNFKASNPVQWSTNFNFSIYNNEVTKLATDDDVLLGNGLMLREGMPIGTFYGYEFDGIFQTDDEASTSAVFANQTSGAGQAKAGDRKYKDINTDGVINEQDRTVIGSALADYTLGINNNLSYKNFTLSFFIQGSFGNDMINLNRLFLEEMDGTHNVSAEAWENRWTPTNPSTEYPRVLANRTTDVGTISSKFIEDASYLRLKNITLGYNLPSALLDSWGLRSLRVYASATNLFTITDYSGYDPEGSSYGTQTAYPGVDQGRYPLTKVYTIGLNLGL